MYEYMTILTLLSFYSKSWWSDRSIWIFGIPVIRLQRIYYFIHIPSNQLIVVKLQFFRELGVLGRSMEKNAYYFFSHFLSLLNFPIDPLSCMSLWANKADKDSS